MVDLVLENYTTERLTEICIAMDNPNLKPEELLMNHARFRELTRLVKNAGYKYDVKVTVVKL